MDEVVKTADRVAQERVFRPTVERDVTKVNPTRRIAPQDWKRTIHSAGCHERHVDIRLTPSDEIEGLRTREASRQDRSVLDRGAKPHEPVVAFGTSLLTTCKIAW